MCWIFEKRLFFQVTEVDSRKTADADLSSCNFPFFRSWISRKWALLFCLWDRLILLRWQRAIGLAASATTNEFYRSFEFHTFLAWSIRLSPVKLRCSKWSALLIKKKKTNTCFPSQRNNHLILTLVERKLAYDMSWGKSTTLIWCITLPLSLC